MAITDIEYGNFQLAFDFFNERLFDGKLTPVLITLQRKKGTRGYFSPNRYKSRVNQGWTDEIALNPAEFVGRTDRAILSTLVHEMCHLYQKIYGNPGRGRYHNKEWVEIMITRGLMPSRTGEPGGKRTGDIVSHYIIEGGKFERACQDLLSTDFRLNWQSVESVSRRKAGPRKKIDMAKPKKDREKFTCPKCRLNAWAKPSAKLICGVCYSEGQSIQQMGKYWDEDFEDWTNEELAGLALVHG